MTGQGLCRWRHWLPVIEAAALLMSYPVVTRLIPLRRLLSMAEIGIVPADCEEPSRSARVPSMGRSVGVAMRRSPWRPLRLPQSAVASLMLRMRGFHPPLCFGIRRIDGYLVVCGGGPIDGLASFGPLPGGFPR